MADLRLMTPEEMQNTRNPAAREKTDILKTPREYGIPMLQKLYRQMYNEFFSRTFDGYPEMVEFTFSDSEEYLGRFICEHEETRDADGNLISFTYKDPKIDFSNSFDLSPYELANVMAHEMIHLGQVVWAANEGTELLDSFDSMDIALGHGDWFDKFAEDINSDLDLAVTAVCDDPTLKNKGQVNYRVESKFFIVLPIGDYAASIVSVPDGYLRQVVADLLSKNKQFRVYFCKDAHFIEQFGHRDPQKGRKTTVPAKIMNSYLNSGILQDNTGILLDGYRKLGCLPDTENAPAQTGTDATPAENEPADDDVQEDAEQDNTDYLMVVELPDAGLVQVTGKGADALEDAKEFAAKYNVPVYTYERCNPNDPTLQNCKADSGIISAAVRRGAARPLFVLLPNGTRMQIVS